MDKNTVKGIVGVCVAVALAATVSVCAMLMLRKNDAASDDEVQTVATEKSAQEGGFYNILFMGTDREAGLCDVMMLINVNTQNDSITMAQIPRDTYARYSDADYKKLNGAYSALGGAEQTAKFLSEALGTPIQYHMCIGLDTVAAVVDTLGGVEINLPCDMKYTDAAQGLYIDLKKGYNLLDGEGAEMFLRFRSGYADGDLGRLDAQKLFMACMFSKLGERFSPVMAARLMGVVEGIETNMSAYDIMWLANRALATNATQIKMLTLPGEALIAKKSGASYYVLSGISTEKLLKEHFCASEKFDEDRAFLNEDYTSFRDAYNSEKQYLLSTVSEIVQKNRE